MNGGCAACSDAYGCLDTYTYMPHFVQTYIYTYMSSFVYVYTHIIHVPSLMHDSWHIYMCFYTLHLTIQVIVCMNCTILYITYTVRLVLIICMICNTNIIYTKCPLFLTHKTFKNISHQTR